MGWRLPLPFAQTIILRSQVRFSDESSSASRVGIQGIATNSSPRRTLRARPAGSSMTPAAPRPPKAIPRHVGRSVATRVTLNSSSKNTASIRNRMNIMWIEPQGRMMRASPSDRPLRSMSPRNRDHSVSAVSARSAKKIRDVRSKIRIGLGGTDSHLVVRPRKLGTLGPRALIPRRPLAVRRFARLNAQIDTDLHGFHGLCP